MAADQMQVSDQLLENAQKSMAERQQGGLLEEAKQIAKDGTLPESAEVTAALEERQALEAGADSEMMKGLEGKKEQAESLSKDELDQIAKDINDGLHTSWVDWNVQEQKVMEAISKVPSHQMEQFLEDNFGSSKAFLDKIADSDAFKTHEYALIAGKVKGDTDMMASALDELMVDKSFMDYANANAGVALMKGLSDSELKAVLAKTNKDAIKQSVEVEFHGSRTKQIEAYAQLARGGVDTYDELANDLKSVLKDRVLSRKTNALDSIQGLDPEKLFAADKDLRGMMLKIAEKSPVHREKALTFVYGQERAEALIAVGSAMDKPENAAAFVSAYNGLSEEQKSQFKKDFAEVYGDKHGNNIDIALSNSLAKDREAWVDTMNAMDNGHSFDKETVMDMDDDTYNALVAGTNERTKEALRDSAYDKATAGKDKKAADVKAEVETDAEMRYTPEQENILTYCKEYSIHPERLKNKTMKGLVVSYVDSLANSNSNEFQKKLSALSNEQKDALIAEAKKWTPETGASTKEQTRSESQRRFQEAFIDKISKSKTPETKPNKTMVA